MTEELKPCPFCGGKVDLIPNINTAGKNLFNIYCVRCDYEFAHFCVDSSMKSLIEKWNRRVTE